jgi:hypothetical protein
MARPEQYVGVSGGVDWYDQSDIREMAAIYHVDRLGAFVMWGVQATKKTQLLEVSNKYGSGWHPVGDAIYDAAYEDETGVTSPFIHIYPGEGTPEEQMETILATTARTEGFHQGIQLNRLDWHKPEYDGFIEDVRDLVGVNVPIVAQFHERVLDALNPDGVVEKITPAAARLRIIRPI